MKIKATLLTLMVIWAVSFQIKTIAQDIAIVNVTVIDCTGSPAKSGMTVQVTDGKIASVEKYNQKNFGSNTRILNGEGKYLIPGLWDMHVHSWNDTLYFPLMIANGVTSLRDMVNNRITLPNKMKWREQINAGKIIGPNLYLPLAVFGPDQKWNNGIIVNSKEDVKAFVQEAIASGADFIKIFDLFEPEIYFTLLSEAQKNGLRVAGHCPLSVNIGDAAQAGQISFEHMLGVLLASSSIEESIRQEMVTKAGQIHDSLSDLTHMMFFLQPEEILESYDPVKADQLFSRLKKSGSYFCPNLSFWNGELKVMNSVPIQNEFTKYVPPKYLARWSTFKSHSFTKNILPDEYVLYKQFIKKRFEMVKELKKHGVPFLAGTDVSWFNYNLIPGVSLHEELSLLVKYGLTPMEALQAATRNGAEVLGVQDKTGTVEVGKCADLVLLDANPLENIGNTTKINSVIKGGNYLSREALDNILQEIEGKANK